MKITFIGGGNMAVALIGGMRKQGFSAAGIQVVEPVEAARTRLNEEFGVRCAPSIDAAALNCETLVLAVKPQQMKDALAPAAGKLKDQLVVSIAAGLRLTDISRWLGGHRRIVRTMPNTPALIGAGVTGLFADASVDLEGRTMAERILTAVGRILWIDDEGMMDPVTAISGSGPAYVFYFMEAMETAAINLGIAPEAARMLAVDTFLGAAKLADSSPEAISLLRERVTSKGGTTEAALTSFDAEDVRAAIERGIQAANVRGRELGDLLGQT